MITRLITAILLAAALRAQTPPRQKPAISFDDIRFLEGKWEAVTPASPAGPTVTGAYSFSKEMSGHILARHSSADECKGPAGFDCDHHDLLYIFQDAPEQPLKAIYFDNEGHTIHYDVLAPSGTQVIFLSSPATAGPRFRLTYELKHNNMFGKFQMQMPGQTEWKSYLEWSGQSISSQAVHPR